MNAVSEPSLCCDLCGRSDVELVAWLSVCYGCLARAGQVAVAGPALPLAGPALSLAGPAKPLAGPALPQITGYSLIRLIGRGGMGSVYEAVRASDGLRVALKLMAREMVDDVRYREQFRRECEVLSRLVHPGVVRRLDSGEEKGRPWLAMELIDGPDLRQVLKRGAMPVARALEIASEVGAALAAGHAAGVIHRDVKPGNVLLAPDGRAKVVDFGMVRIREPNSESGNQTTVMTVITGRYAAPELERRGVVDARADIYSLGALLHHLLTGNAPRVHYRPASRERPDAGISAGVDRIVARCLQTDPNRRYRSMDDLLVAMSVERRRLERPRRVRWQWVAVSSVVLMALTYAGIRGYMSPQKAAGEKMDRLIASRLSPIPSNWEPRTITNTLGMPFVEIPGCEVLFCVWETRVQDYAAFAEQQPQPEDEWVKETGFAFPLEKPVFSLLEGELKAAGKSWRDPGFPSGPDYAVCGVSASDAMAFCTWLTWKERREGKIRNDQAYRLPTDGEWSTAAGLAPEQGATPGERAASWPVDSYAHPWGLAWPSPDNLYNVVGDEVDGWIDWPSHWEHPLRLDPWRGTAPVASVQPDGRGLYHLIGNVWEWTETPYNNGAERHFLVLRGGSWMDASREALSLAFRDHDSGTMRMTNRGFRIVLQESGAEGWRYGVGR